MSNREFAVIAPRLPGPTEARPQTAGVPEKCDQRDLLRAAERLRSEDLTSVDEIYQLLEDHVAQLVAWDGPVRVAGAEVDGLFWGYVDGAIHSGRTAIARIIRDGCRANPACPR